METVKGSLRQWRTKEALKNNKQVPTGNRTLIAFEAQAKARNDNETSKELYFMSQPQVHYRTYIETILACVVRPYLYEKMAVVWHDLLYVNKLPSEKHQTLIKQFEREIAARNKARAENWQKNWAYPSLRTAEQQQERAIEEQYSESPLPDERDTIASLFNEPKEAGRERVKAGKQERYRSLVPRYAEKDPQYLRLLKLKDTIFNDRVARLKQWHVEVSKGITDLLENRIAIDLDAIKKFHQDAKKEWKKEDIETISDTIDTRGVIRDFINKTKNGLGGPQLRLDDLLAVFQLKDPELDFNLLRRYANNEEGDNEVFDDDEDDLDATSFWPNDGFGVGESFRGVEDATDAKIKQQNLKMVRETIDEICSDLYKLHAWLVSSYQGDVERTFEEANVEMGERMLQKMKDIDKKMHQEYVEFINKCYLQQPNKSIVEADVENKTLYLALVHREAMKKSAEGVITAVIARAQ